MHITLRKKNYTIEGCWSSSCYHPDGRRNVRWSCAWEQVGNTEFPQGKCRSPCLPQVSQPGSESCHAATPTTRGTWWDLQEEIVSGTWEGTHRQYDYSRVCGTVAGHQPRTKGSSLGYELMLGSAGIAQGQVQSPHSPDPGQSPSRKAAKVVPTSHTWSQSCEHHRGSGHFILMNWFGGFVDASSINGLHFGSCLGPKGVPLHHTAQ